MASDDNEESPLGTWRRTYRVTMAEMGRRLSTTPQHVAKLCAHGARPSDPMKVKIAAVTLEIENELRVGEPKGVPILAWFPAVQQRDDAQAAG